MHVAMKIAAVALGGAVGAVARYGIAVACESFHLFPWGTLIANAVGCLLIGAVMWVAWGRADEAGEWAMSEGWRLFLAVGLLGALTTFSTFAYEAFQMLGYEGQSSRGVFYIAVSVLIGLITVVMGWNAAKFVLA